MKIALVSTYPPGKGSLNEYAFHFVKHLRTKSEVSEITLLVDELEAEGYTPEATNNGCVGLNFQESWQFGHWRNAWRIQKAVAEVQPDVVLFNIQFASFADQRIPAALGLLAPWLVRQTGAVSTVLLHNIMETVDLGKAGFDTNPVSEYITRTAGTIFTKMLLRADMVAVTIPKYVEILTEKYGVEHVVLAPHGAFEDVEQPTYDLPDGPLQIMTFGKFGTYKRIEILLEAFRILQSRLSQPLELVIAGSDSPNAKGYLAEMQTQYANVKSVRYTGYVAEEEVPRIFKESAVVVFPYNSTTGSSGVLHQAGNYGRAVVLPNLGDFAELITEEGYTGEFYTPDSAEELADAIEKFLVSAEYRQQCGMQNFLAATGIPMSEVVDWYLLHFERLLNNKQAQHA